MDVIAWLRDGDPAIAWHAARELGDPEAAALRARVAREGLGAQILARQDADGAWHKADEPTWVSTLYTMTLLRATGIDPADPAVVAAMARLAAGFRWDAELGGAAFFDGETEPCINGGALAAGSYLGRASGALAHRLVGEQLADGGWNCAAPPSTRGSFHSTICVLEGLLEYERAAGPTPAVTEARRRGEAYLLDRGLLRRRSTGEVASAAFVDLAFPPRYHYDVLRGLDYLRAAGLAPDPRAAEAVQRVADRRQPDGRWRLDASHPDGLDVTLGEAVGAPSRWITLRARRVLAWFAP